MVLIETLATLFLEKPTATQMAMVLTDDLIIQDAKFLKPSAIPLISARTALTLQCSWLKLFKVLVLCPMVPPLIGALILEPPLT